MLLVDTLPPRTRALYDALNDTEEIAGFDLVGGTALALHHGHRISEDLDFFFRGTRLPRKTIDAILASLDAAGLKVGPATDPGDVERASEDCIDLADYQQDYSVSGAKLTFAAWDQDHEVSRAIQAMKVQDGSIFVMGSDALFELKSRLLATRCTARDQFDLWFYLQHLGKGLEDVVRFAHDQDRVYTDRLVRERLLFERKLDPGFQTLLPGAPKNQRETIERLRVMYDAYEARIAEDLASKCGNK